MVGNGVEISWVADQRGVPHDSAPWILHEDGTWLIEVISGSHSFPWRQSVTRSHEQDRRRANERALRYARPCRKAAYDCRVKGS